MENLETLVREAQNDDLQAFGAIVTRFRDMACGYAHSQLGDFQLAEDAAQEAFIDAYHKLDDLREPAAFPGWFRRIVFKHCDRIRRRPSYATVPLDEAHAAPTGYVPPPKEDVLEAIGELPERERTVTTLFYMNGYSQQEVADFLDVPLTTVKKRLYNARQKLKEALLDTVRTALRSHAPDERFSQKVMEGLQRRPRLLGIPGHPVREAWESIRTALADWEVIKAPERLVHDPGKKTRTRSPFDYQTFAENIPVDIAFILDNRGYANTHLGQRHRNSALRLGCGDVKLRQVKRFGWSSI